MTLTVNKHRLLLLLSSMTSLLVFCLCWSLLVDGQVFPFVSNCIQFAESFLKREVITELKIHIETITNYTCLGVKILAVTSSILFSSSLLASTVPLTFLLGSILLQPWEIPVRLIVLQVCL